MFLQNLPQLMRRSVFYVLLCGFLIGLNAQAISVPAPAETTPAVGFNNIESALKGLQADDLAAKQAAVEQLPSFNHPQTEAILSALADGKLWVDGEQFIIASDAAGKSQAHLALKPEQSVDATADAKKITINNKIRLWIKNYVAEHALARSDAGKRLAAMKQVMDKTDGAVLKQVQQAMSVEQNSGIKTLMLIYLAKADLRASDLTLHNKAIDTLSNAADPTSHEALTAYIETAPNAALKAQAAAGIKSIDNKLSMLKGVETVSFGLSLGSVLVLSAIGLAITFGVMGVINMAHGELMMIGAYCAYVVQLLMPNYIEWSILVAIPVAFVVSGMVGVLIERFVVRYLYGRPLETLLATFGVSLILQQAVRTVFSPLNKMVQAPQWMSGAWEISPGLSLTWNRVYIIIFCLACFFTLLAIMRKTRLGLEVRAVSQNRGMARAMGISDRKVDMLTFALGSGVAGVAGVALSQLTNVGPSLGQAYIVDSFMVVVVGGVGNLWGTLVSGLALGVLNKLFEPWLGAVLAKVIVLVLIILFIQKYPRGLFPQKGRSADE